MCNDLQRALEAGVLAKTYIKKGLLVPDHVMTRLLLPRLEEMTKYSWLLDGFPRTLAQADALNSICDLDVVFNLNIPLETLKERLRHRWTHPSSGRVYNMYFNPPRIQGLDDITGEQLIQQEEDRPEALVARLRHYKDIAKPVIDLYKAKSILYTFSDTETDRIWPNISTLLSTKIPIVQSDARCTSTH
ncbi:adenylate kinase 4, mitochondrial isoform X2 [Triplophysa dalaica]|uniref:adenylate kinase 4, mitochondrial isoform X2 n=1 Tax=Triplophysa dalaica TaxID=1582913 RepID=UPI0024DF7864|nr:adenylate kinase 4, mitochondrial isoform X2 [Triplophysa dalaica]